MISSRCVDFDKVDWQINFKYYVIDPTCGSGGFLLEVLLQVWNRLDRDYAGRRELERIKTDFALNQQCAETEFYCKSAQSCMGRRLHAIYISTQNILPLRHSRLVFQKSDRIQNIGKGQHTACDCNFQSCAENSTTQRSSHLPFWQRLSIHFLCLQ